MTCSLKFGAGKGGGLGKLGKRNVKCMRGYLPLSLSLCVCLCVYACMQVGTYTELVASCLCVRMYVYFTFVHSRARKYNNMDFFLANKGFYQYHQGREKER